MRMWEHLKSSLVLSDPLLSRLSLVRGVRVGVHEVRVDVEGDELGDNSIYT